MLKRRFSKGIVLFSLLCFVIQQGDALVADVHLKSVLVRQVAIYGTKDVNSTLAGSGQLTKSYNYSPNGINQAVDKMSSKAFIQPKALDVNISQNPFQYSGEYQDLESGLYYQRARYYNPRIQRFIQRDSYNLLNRYNYANGNPILNVDPSGHISKTGRLILNFSGLLGDILGAIFSGGSSLALTAALVGIGSSTTGISGALSNNQKFNRASNILGYISLAFGGGALFKGIYEGYKGVVIGKMRAGGGRLEGLVARALKNGAKEQMSNGEKELIVSDYVQKILKKSKTSAFLRGARDGRYPGADRFVEEAFTIDAKSHKAIRKLGAKYGLEINGKKVVSKEPLEGDYSGLALSREKDKL